MTAVSLWFRKDVRRFALWLAVWAGVLALRVVIDAGVTLPWLGRVALDNLGVAATTVLFLLIAVLVVHEDPPGDLRAFWTTRAVSGGQLFAAKSLFVFGLLVVPATAVDLVDIAATGMEWGVVLRACPEIVLEWSAWAMATMAIAAVTTTLPGFLGGAFAGGGVVVTTWSLLMLLWAAPYWILAGWMGAFFAMNEPSTSDMRLAMALREGARALGIAAIVALGAALVAERTWARRRIRASRWALLCCVAALTVLWWYWPYRRSEAVAALENAPSYDGVQLALDPIGHSEPTVVGGGNMSPRMEISGRFSFTGLPEGLVADVVGVPGAISYVDGTTFQTRTNVGQIPMAPSWNVAEVERLLDATHLMNVDAAARLGLTPLTKIPPELFAARRGSHGRLQLRADVMLRRYAVSAILPLKEGAAFRQDGEEFVIEGVTNTDGVVAIQARGAYLSLWVRPELPRVIGTFAFRFDPGVLWVLRNPIRREAVLPQQGMAVGFGWPTHARLDQVAWMLTYESAGIIDEVWLRDAELVRIAVTTEGELKRSFVLPAFAIDEAAGRPDPADARLYGPVPGGFPPQSSAESRRDLVDYPGVSACTLSDGALMTLDWGSETMRTVGMRIVAQREAPESGVEFDVQVDARPRTPPSPDPDARRLSHQALAVRWQDDNTLYLVSSERGGQHALVDLDLTQCETFALRFTLVSIDGREPGYDTPQIRVGVIVTGQMAPDPYLLAVPTWSTVASANLPRDPWVTMRPRLRQIGFVMQLDDSRWANRRAMLRLRVEPVASAIALDPTKDLHAPAHSSRRATLSMDALRSLVAVQGGVFVRELSMSERAVDIDLSIDVNPATVSAPDELLAQLRGAYDVVEVRATLLAVNGQASGVGKRIGVAFAGTPLWDVPQLSLDQADPSAIVSLETDRLENMVALNVWPLWGKNEAETAMKVESVTLRLEPVPGATPVP